MTGQEFIAAFSKKGYAAWEAAALELARQGKLTPWPWVDVTLSNGEDRAVVKVSSDVLAVGPLEDFVRLPLTPVTAQNILNLSGALMTTPWLEHQIWRAAPVKLQPISAAAMKQTNLGANLAQYVEHSRRIDEQLRALNIKPGALVSGTKKGIVVSNIWSPLGDVAGNRRGKVNIAGWYRPPPAPDVFDDHKALGADDRQPIQPNSDAHGDFYVDYSHGVRAVAPFALVNGQPMATVDLYTHPTLSKLVSHNGPIKLPRYPGTTVSPATPPPPIAGPASNSPEQAFDLGPLLHPPNPGPEQIALEALQPSTGNLAAARGCWPFSYFAPLTRPLPRAEDGAWWRPRRRGH